MQDKYVKVVYQTEPIGKERIVLYLTTFDLEAFQKDQNLEKIPTKQIVRAFEAPTQINFETSDMVVNYNNYQVKMFETILEKIVRDTYENQLEEMTSIIETLRNTKIIPINYDSKIKNISNSDDVHCDIVYGNISNCDNIYCTEIKGNVVNCDKIVYKK